MAADARIEQVLQQNALIADVQYLLAKNEGNFVTAEDWQEAKTKVNALNPERYRF